jgi:hypothetical protein
VRGVSMVFVYCHDKSTKNAFSFTFSAGPSSKFCFDGPVAVHVPSNRPFKRRRALSDVDGGGNAGRKKRRLRLQLITSRLSRPFSQPASNIVNRGLSKIAVWGKKKSLGKSVLRKAAIMNRVRLRLSREKEAMLQQQEKRERLAMREFPNTLAVKPHWRHEIQLPPSPLGLSNYDALDLEDGLFDDEETEGGTERCSAIYSDFNIMNPTSEGDDYDFLDALDGISPEDLPDTPPAPLENGIAEILREEERQGDSVFVHLKG